MTIYKAGKISLDQLGLLAVQAGAAIMAHYANMDDAVLNPKADDSPLTKADLAADKIIAAGLAEFYPDIPVVSEEQAASHQQIGLKRFFLVDPLDGTKEFISKNGEFTVNIALIDDGMPILGAVYAPVHKRLFLGAVRDADLLGAWEMAVAPDAQELPKGKPLAIRKAGPNRAAIASRSHRTAETDTFLNLHHIQNCVAAGSSLKFCLLAAGEADLYPRFGPTMEWDTAAGHAVLNAAGGSVCNVDGTPLTYGKAHYRNPNFIAVGCQQQSVYFTAD